MRSVGLRYSVVFFLIQVVWPMLALTHQPKVSVLAAQEHSEKPGASFEYFHALAMNADGRTLFLGTRFGLLRSEDGGRLWKKLAIASKYPHLDVTAIAPDPQDPRTIYVGTHEAGVFKSTDHGTTWRDANTKLGGPDVRGLSVDSGDARKLYAALRGIGEGIYRTTDGGGKWYRVDDGPGGEVNFLASVKPPVEIGVTHLYAGTAHGLQHTPESFEGWTPMAGLPTRRTVKASQCPRGARKSCM